MHTDNDNIITIISSIFTIVAFAAALSFGGSQLISVTSNTTQEAAETAQNTRSNLSVQSVTQTASAQSGCSTYGKKLGTSKCHRSGSTAYTVVLGTSTSVDAIDDPTPTSDYIVEEGESFVADGNGSNPDGVLENDIPGKSGLEVSNWDLSGLQGSMPGSGRDDIAGTFEYNAPGSVSGTTTTTFNYTATNGTSSDTATGSIKITESSPSTQPPSAACEWTGTATPDGLISYQDDGSTDPDGNIESYDWIITKPDGPDDTDSGPSGGSYNNPSVGEYEAELTVTDDDGATHTATCDIEVSDYDPAFDIDPQQETVWVVADEPATSTEANYDLIPTGTPKIPEEDIEVEILPSSQIDEQHVYIDRPGGDVSLTVRKTPDGLDAGTYEVYMEATASTTLGTVVKTATTSVRAQTTAEF